METLSKHISAQERKHVIAYLKFHGLIGEIWTVYTWDDSPVVCGLLVSDDHVLRSINAAIYPDLTRDQLRTILKTEEIASFPASFGKKVGDERIEEFYRRRRDRRIREDDTPPNPTACRVLATVGF